MESRSSLLLILLAAGCALVASEPASAQEEFTFRSLAEDNALVFADQYAHTAERSRGTALLFHDQASGVVEYADIAPRLVELGFEVIAVDLRTGSDLPGVRNRTFNNTRAYNDNFDAGLPDVEGALTWARQALPDDPIVIFGSGVSGDMAIVAAANDPEGIAGVLAFSPPSWQVHSDEAEAASRLTMPLFVTYATTPTDERAMVSKITDAAPPDLLTLHAPEVGAHGVATLTEVGNPEGWETNWAAVETFLDRVAP